jgi:hypothetical protein
VKEPETIHQAIIASSRRLLARGSVRGSSGNISLAALYRALRSEPGEMAPC